MPVTGRAVAMTHAINCRQVQCSTIIEENKINESMYIIITDCDKQDMEIRMP